MTGVLIGLGFAYVGAAATVGRELHSRKIEQSKAESRVWNQSSSAGSVVAYRAYIARFPRFASKAEEAILELLRKRSPAFKNVNRVRLISRQSYGGAKVLLPIRDMAVGWLSLAGLSVAKDGDPRYDAELILDVQGKALSEVYTFRSNNSIPGYMPFLGGGLDGARATRHTGAVVQGEISFVVPEGLLGRKPFFYRINPPESLTVATHSSLGVIGNDGPGDAPFLSALEKSLAPAMARIMAENFGRDILEKGVVSSVSLVKIGAEVEKAKRMK